MFLTTNEIEQINREISALASVIDDATGENPKAAVDLNKPDPGAAVSFMRQASDNDKMVAAGLLLKMVPGATAIPEEQEAREITRNFAIHNVICALMVLRSLS